VTNPAPQPAPKPGDAAAAPAIHVPISGVTRFDLPWQRRLKWTGPESEPGLQGTPTMLAQDAALIKRGYWFNPKEADRKMRIWHLLRQVRGDNAGRAIEPTPYQIATLRRLWGWMRDGPQARTILDLPPSHPAKHPNVRRYTTFESWMPTGNGKTGTAAALALTMLAFDGELQPSIDLVSNSLDQTKKTIWEDLKLTIKQSDELAANLSMYAEAIACEQIEGHIKMLPLEERTTDGLRTSCLIGDEVHKFTNRAAWAQAEKSLSKRKRPLTVIISTHGTSTLNFGRELYESSRHIWRGTLEDPARLVMIHESDPEVEDWRSPDLWAGVNPAWGTSWGPSLVRMQEAMTKLLAEPNGETEFRTYRVGQWITGATAAIKPELWKAAAWSSERHRPVVCVEAQRMPTLEEMVRSKADCWGGLDLSLRDDLTAFALVCRPRQGPLAAGDRLYVYVKLYCPEDNLEQRSSEHRVDYTRWVREGWLTATPGNTIDSKQIIGDVAKAHKLLRLTRVDADQNHAKAELQSLHEDFGVPILAVPQNYTTWTPAANLLQESLMQHRLVHEANPAMAWMCANLTYRRRTGGSDEVMPRKFGQEGSGGTSRSKRRYKIDGMVALLLALHASIQERPKPQIDWLSILNNLGR
jgi:phage terminase large subunit-like protein